MDGALVLLLESQTQSLRLLDRRLGAARLLAQTESHLAQMSDLLTYEDARNVGDTVPLDKDVPPRRRPQVAGKPADARCL